MVEGRGRCQTPLMANLAGELCKVTVLTFQTAQWARMLPPGLSFPLSSTWGQAYITL